MLAVQNAGDNPDFYGPDYAHVELVREVVSAEEGEDYYRVRLSYRPVRGFAGEPGLELFTIDKAGPVTLRQLIKEPRRRRPVWLFTGVGLAVAVGVVVAVLFAAGVLSGKAETSMSAVVELVPAARAQLTSPDGDVTVDIEDGAVHGPVDLRYERRSGDQLPPVPAGFSSVHMGFELTIVEKTGIMPGYTFNKPLILNVRLTPTALVELTQNPDGRAVILHYDEPNGRWDELNTDYPDAATARALVYRLSLFALVLCATGQIGNT